MKLTKEILTSLIRETLKEEILPKTQEEITVSVINNLKTSIYEIEQEIFEKKEEIKLLKQRIKAEESQLNKMRASKLE